MRKLQLPVSQDPKLRRLTSLIVASSNFQAAADACSFLIENDINENATYIRAFAAGIVVSYMRPFVQGDGLTGLPEYEKFPANPEYVVLHEELKNGRNKVFAHHSETDSHSLLPKELQEDAKRIRLHFDDSGVLTGYVLKPISWNRSRLHAIASLCRFQKERIDAEASGLVEHLREGRFYRGEVIIGESFP
jgi:hypothetical protein